MKLSSITRLAELCWTPHAELTLGTSLEC